VWRVNGVSMVRVWLAFAVAFLVVPQAWGLDAAARKQYIEDLRREEAAKGTNSLGMANFMEVMEKRFPDDFNALLDRLAALGNSRDRYAMRTFALAMIKVYGRDGNRLKSAPAPSLKAVLQAQRSVVDEASRHNPELCKTMVTGSEVVIAPSPDIHRKTIALRVAVFNAIADGKDTPVAPRGAATTNDYQALGQDLQKRGIDVSSWSVLEPEESKSASPPALCKALLSHYDAILASNGAVGEKLVAEVAMDLLKNEMTLYRKMMQ
jgi:hypothetical protein